MILAENNNNNKKTTTKKIAQIAQTPNTFGIYSLLCTP